MHSRILGLMAVLLVGAGWASAQAPSVNQAPAAPALGTIPAGPAVLPADAAIAGPMSSGPVLYGGADYILWQVRKGNLPQAVTTVPVGLLAFKITDKYEERLFGDQNTLIFTPTWYAFAPLSIQNQATFGGEQFTNIGSQNGGRFTAGFWADEDLSWGLEGSFLFLERGADRFAAVASNPGNQFLLDTGFKPTWRVDRLVLTGTPQDQQTTISTILVNTSNVAGPRQSTSSVVGNSAVMLYGAEVNVRGVGLRFGGFDLGGLAGFRYLGFRDELSVFNNVRLFRPSAALDRQPGEASFTMSEDLTFSSADRVKIWNNFYGGQLGIDLDAKFGPFFLYARVKGAVGNMHQVAEVDSHTNVVNNDQDPRRMLNPPSTSTAGGLLASPADNGRHSRNRFAFVPEGNFKFGYQFTDWLRGYLGYDVILIGHAARAGVSATVTTLDTNITLNNTTQNVNVAQPTFRFRDQDVWVQGVTFGFEARY